jgi:hypothetical protein
LYIKIDDLFLIDEKPYPIAVVAKFIAFGVSEYGDPDPGCFIVFQVAFLQKQTLGVVLQSQPQ